MEKQVNGISNGQQQCACVVLAAGHGKIGDIPKLLAPLGPGSVIDQVVRTVKQAGNFSPIVVVLNPATADDFRSELGRAGHTDLVYAIQGEPRGMPDAVYRACLAPEMADVGHMLMMPGDSALWMSDTLNVLRRKHFNPQQHKLVPGIRREMFPSRASKPRVSDVTTLTFPYKPDHELARFVRGRSFLSGEEMIYGRPMCVLNQGDYTPSSGAEMTTGLAVFRKSWILGFSTLFESNTEVEVDDRHPEATALPTLLNWPGVTVTNVTGYFDTQVLDINTAEHLEVASRVLAGRSKTQSTAW